MGSLGHERDNSAYFGPAMLLGPNGASTRLPLVTVVVTVYNYENYITKCLESIAAQDYPRFRCVIIDDVSTDSSVARVESFIEGHALSERFRLFRHARNLGQMAAFRTGLAHATGEFVAFVDADDMWQPDFLSRHIHAHLSFQPVAFTSSDQYQINDNDELIAGQHTDHQGRGNFVLVKPFQIYVNWWVWGTTSTMVFRKAVLDVLMPENTEPFRRCADNYMCHFAHLLGGSLLIPERLGFYRRHRRNLFSGNPIIGGDFQPTGNMTHHPSHEAVR
ncbi:MAG: glycosyltransferase, partial [Methylococcales bacterium]